MSDIKQFVSILEEENSNDKTFEITYIVNTKATLLPTFVIQKKIRKKAENTKNVSFVLDKEKVLIDLWKLQDHSANILVLSSSNTILYQYSGKVKSDQIEKIMKVINLSETNQN